MTTIKILAVVFAMVLVYGMSWLFQLDIRDVMTVVAFVGTINLLTSKWISLLYMREVMKGMAKGKNDNSGSN